MRAFSVTAAIGTSVLCAGAAIPAAVAAPDYPPTSPTRAAGVCVGDIPYFAYEVDFGSDEFVGSPMTITFVNPNGADAVINTTVPAVGEPAAELWPGASEDPQDWPGWELDENGVWVETTEDEGAFTRAPGGVEVQFATNPTLSTTVTYPPATTACANPAQGPGGEGGPTTVSNDTTSGGAGGAGQPVEASESRSAAPSAQTTPQTGANLVLPVALGLAALGIGAGLFAAARRKA